MTRTFDRTFVPDAHLSQLVRRNALAFSGEKQELDSLIELIGDASFVRRGSG